MSKTLSATQTLRYEVYEITDSQNPCSLVAAFADHDDAENLTVSTFGTRTLFVVDRNETE